MNIEKVLAEMDAAHKEKMAKLDAEYEAESAKIRAQREADEAVHKAEMAKLREERKAAEAEAAVIDDEIAAIDAVISSSKERTENKIKLFEAAQNRALQARTKEEIETAYAELRSVIESF